MSMSMLMSMSMSMSMSMLMSMSTPLFSHNLVESGDYVRILVLFTINFFIIFLLLVQP
jgi:hypothetical protein